MISNRVPPLSIKQGSAGLRIHNLRKTYKSKLKDLGKVFSENQIDLCKFISTFFELFRNPNINKNL